MQKQLFVLVFLAVLTTPIFAQQQLWCATPDDGPEREWLRNFQDRLANEDDFKENLALARSGGQPIYIPVKAHLVGTSEGKGYFKHDHLLQAICELNERYAEIPFHFYLDLPIDYIDNDDYYQQDFSAGFSMMVGNNVSGALNMYYVAQIGSSGGTSFIAGYFSPSGGAIAMRNNSSAPGRTTITHEVGHFFSLPHTFKYWEGGAPGAGLQELVDGSNCSTAGDGFCDTPPDYAPYPWNCPSEGPFTDPAGTTFYVTDSFYMSYAQSLCPSYFSLEQMMAMENYLLAEHPDLNTTITPFIPAVSEPVSLLEPTPDELNVAPIGYRFKWAPKPDAVAYHISIGYTHIFNAIAEETIVEDTSFLSLDLLENRTYYWKVKPLYEGNTCEDYSEVRSFTTGNFPVGTTGLDNLEQTFELELSPNPVKAGSAISINQGAVNGNFVYRLIDLNGRLVDAQELHLTGQGSVEIAIPSTLAAGLYLVELSSAGDSRKLRSKVQVQD